MSNEAEFKLFELNMDDFREARLRRTSFHDLGSLFHDSMPDNKLEKFESGLAVDSKLFSSCDLCSHSGKTDGKTLK